MDHDPEYLFREWKQFWNSFTCVRRLICREGHVSSLNKSNPILGPPRIFKYLTRAEEIVITRLRIGHTKAINSHIVSRGPPTACQHCGQILTIEHIFLECTVLQHSRDGYFTVDSLRTLFETITEACIIDFLREAGFYYRIWMAVYPIQLYSNQSPTDDIIKLN